MQSRAEVVIVGGGPVGLALATELGLRGRRVVLVEQGTREGRQPRAKTTNIRTMAHMRRWGLAARIHDASPMPAGYPADIVFATRLFGFPLARFANVFFAEDEPNPLFPEHAEWIPQYVVEAVLRERLADLSNVELRFGLRLEALSQNESGVVATVVAADGRSTEIAADYLVGADGGRSTTRTLRGIEMVGDHAYMANYLAIYHAPGLLETHPQAKALSYWLVNEDSPAVTGPMDRDDIWFFSAQMPKRKERYTAEETEQLIRHAIGRDIPLTILETDVWQAHRLVADSYRDGRIFLVGDACHLHPPMGGYGMNQGIGDAVDLGWKLDAVLSGWGGADLLDAYERERRPVNRMFVEEATENYGFVTHHMVNPALERDDETGAAARQELGGRILAGKAREFKAIGIVLGYSYAGSKLILDDGSEAPVMDAMTYRPSARPGSLAPHMWLPDGRSLYDLFGTGLTLLTIGAADDPAELVEAADGLDIPLTVVPLAGAEAERLYGGRFVLVRPDQHVAWRADEAPGDPAAVLRAVTGRGQERPRPVPTRADRQQVSR